MRFLPMAKYPCLRCCMFTITQHISTWIKMERADLRGGGKLNGLGNPFVQVCSLLTKSPLES